MQRRLVPTLAPCLAALIALVACSLPGSGQAGGGTWLPRVIAPGPYHPQRPPRPGGTITVGTDALPDRLGPYVGTGVAAVAIQQAIFSALVSTDPQLGWYGDLAQQVPTLQNGGVRPSGAGMEVTYKLRPGLRWSDGQPITSQDVIFTLQAIRELPAAPQEGYDLITSIEPSGDQVVVIHFRSIDPSYLELFPVVLPAHRLQSLSAADLAANQYWTKPDVVSGPFQVTSVSTDRIVLSRNPHYADGRQGMPLLAHPAYADHLVFEAFPSRQAVLAEMEAGDVQVGLDMTEEELPTIARLRDLHVVLEPSLAYEQVSLNQADPNPTTTPPPPWVGDPAVAQALDLAIDRPALQQGPGDGRSPLAAGPISPLVSWARDPELSSPSYDLAQAQRILDADGWKPGPGGVRAKGGRRLAFTLTGPAGEAVRAEEEDILVQSWRRLGADVQVADAPPQLLLAPYQQGGLLARGMYQAAIWSWIPPVDPDVWYTIFSSSQVPAPSNPGGQNFSRCHDPAIDQALAQARGTLDTSARASAYRAFQRAYVQARCELPLLQHLDIGVTSPHLHNFAPNASPAGNTWNVDDWWLG